MRKYICAMVFGCVLAGGTAWAQSASAELIDTYRVRIKPEKRMEYEAAVRKIADLNRKNGMRWVAYATEYGESGSYYYSSMRTNWADVESAQETFLKAMLEGLGSGMPKFFADMAAINNTSGSEIRRRRLDLSVNWPSDETERRRMVANAKYLRTIRIEIKPGRTLDWAEAWKPWQAELAAVEPKLSAAVSVTSTGRPAVVVASYFRDMAEMDGGDAAIQKVLAGDVYRNFLRASADLIVSTNWEIHRIRPELSSMPDEFISMNPSFWQPKTVASRIKKSAPAPKKQ